MTNIGSISIRRLQCRLDIDLTLTQVVLFVGSTFISIHNHVGYLLKSMFYIFKTNLDYHGKYVTILIFFNIFLFHTEKIYMKQDKRIFLLAYITKEVYVVQTVGLSVGLSVSLEN